MANLKIVEVRGVGTDNERVFMKAANDLELGNYIITDATYDSNGNISNKLRHVYEFAPKSISKGEYVCLHSKAGKNTMDETTGDNPTPIHRIYWGLKERIWNQEGDQVHLLYSPRDHRQSALVPEAET